MSEYYDRTGKPITQEQWIKDFSNIEGKRVAQTIISAGEVSTVWLGLDHRYGDGPPLIFETMVFFDGHPMDQDQWRYSTEADALAGHEKACQEVREHLP